MHHAGNGLTQEDCVGCLSPPTTFAAGWQCPIMPDSGDDDITEKREYGLQEATMAPVPVARSYHTGRMCLPLHS